MANPRRAMARMVRIDSVEPIEGADRIEAAHVGGWTVVVGKDSFKPGDVAVYYEIDTFLPDGDERYAEFQKRGQKEMVADGAVLRGHVLRTARMRGTYSQGLLMRPSDVLPERIPESAYEGMCDRGANVTGIVGVREYVATQPMNAAFVGRYDPYVAPRTDAERIQNIDADVWDLVKRTDYFVSVKVDGTSITFLCDDRTQTFRAFSHNNELDLTKPGIPQIVMDCAERQGLRDFCERNVNVAVQAELVGNKIQSNRLGINGHRLLVFSLWSRERSCYLDPYQTLWDFGDDRTRSSLVPRLRVDLGQFDRPEDFRDFADGMRGHVTKGRLDEGAVVHVMGFGDLSNEERARLRSVLGPTMQVKAVSSRYLMKAGG